MAFAGFRDRLNPSGDAFLPIVRLSWQGPGGYFRGTPACLSCLLVAKRFDELLALLDTEAIETWIEQLISSNETDAFVRKQLATPDGVRRPTPRA